MTNISSHDRRFFSMEIARCRNGPTVTQTVAATSMCPAALPRGRKWRKVRYSLTGIMSRWRFVLQSAHGHGPVRQLNSDTNQRVHKNANSDRRSPHGRHASGSERPTQGSAFHLRARTAHVPVRRRRRLARRAVQKGRYQADRRRACHASAHRPVAELQHPAAGGGGLHGAGTRRPLGEQRYRHHPRAPAARRGRGRARTARARLRTGAAAGQQRRGRALHALSVAGRQGAAGALHRHRRRRSVRPEQVRPARGRWHHPHRRASGRGLLPRQMGGPVHGRRERSAVGRSGTRHVQPG